MGLKSIVFLQAFIGTHPERLSALLRSIGNPDAKAESKATEDELMDRLPYSGTLIKKEQDEQLMRRITKKFNR